MPKYENNIYYIVFLLNTPLPSKLKSTEIGSQNDRNDLKIILHYTPFKNIHHGNQKWKWEETHLKLRPGFHGESLLLQPLFFFLLSMSTNRVNGYLKLNTSQMMVFSNSLFMGYVVVIVHDNLVDKKIIEMRLICSVER